MNSKRRAELQRKLSMGAVPRPPADLAERIKADIPKHLQAHPSPERFSWSTTMRLAASILLLLMTAIVTHEMLRPSHNGEMAVTAVRSSEKVTPAVVRYQGQPRAADTATQAPAESEVSLVIAQELPPPAAPRVAAPAAPEPERRRDQDFLADAIEETSIQSAPVQMAEANAAPPPALAVPPPPMPVAPASAAAPAPAPAMGRLAHAESITITAQAPLIEPPQRSEAAAMTTESRAESVFGISIDPSAFPTVRSAIETGDRPDPGIVNVEALVNYFAGAQAPRRDVSLEVEASPTPVAKEGDRAILRFTVDTASVDPPNSGYLAPVARDARLHVDIDPRAVAAFRRIGEGEADNSEDALRQNTSVTGLYELSLKPNLRSSQRVATVTLRYVSARTGRPQTISHVIHGHDLAKSWDKASRRHRLAALGAVWSETLKGTNGGAEIAKRAEELATQNPGDSRARELAKAASASTGGAR